MRSSQVLDNARMPTAFTALPADAPTERAIASGLRWQNRFAGLGPAFSTRLSPQPLPAPYWVARSEPAARLLGLDPAWFA